MHTLTGDRKGTWSLSVTRNRRLTFTIDDEREICDLNLEDYHQQKGVPNYANEEPTAPRRFHPNGDHRTQWLVRYRRRRRLHVFALSSLLNGKADLSGEMALRIEKAFGVKMETLMRMQSAFDNARTRSREKEIRVRRFHPRVESHP